MREREPLAQLSGRFLWCSAIKRHRRGRTAGKPRKLRAPFAAADAGDLDSVLPAVDGFFEAMFVHDTPDVMKNMSRKRELV